MVKKNTLGKDERLKSRKLIEQLFEKGQRFNVQGFRASYLLTPNVDSIKVQFGVGVSSKQFKRATDRNRIKRLIRESYRLQKNDWISELKIVDAQLSLFVIYSGKEIPVYQVVYDKLGVILKTLIKKVNESISSHT